MPASCYLCARTLDHAKKHGEHIIQNAIGGVLISDDILCEACGGKLGHTVDAAFAAGLAPLTVLLDLQRDRGDYSRVGATLVAKTVEAASLENIQFTLHSDFSVVPRQPVFLRDDVNRSVTVIGATGKQAKQFANSPQIQALVAGGYTLELSTNAATHAQKLLVPVEPNSKAILRGVLKIAIGYAIWNGVPRNNIEHLLDQDDLTNSDSVLGSTVFPYYPTTDAERLFETDKHTHEDWYPTHHLYLFSQKTNLYCYVELFGAIQKYVHLTGRYAGPPLIHKFVQKAEKWEFDEKKFTARDPKDLHILAGQFGVKMNGRRQADIQKDVLNQARSRAYSLEPDNTIKKVCHLIGLLIQFSLLKNENQFEVVRSVFDKASMAKAQLGLSLLDDLRANPMIGLPLVRETFEDFRIGSVGASCPEQARKVNVVNLDQYAAYKIYELLRAKGRESLLQYTII
ncbi:HNH endonuclease [Zoogloea sp.]|uniref:HNH endonuclease n=1 Tax=Zoogloea sp. TaxID=49181 RepID=UPI0035ADAEA1